MTERLGETRAVPVPFGVSLFVVAFAVFPVAAALFQQAAVPHRLIPPAIALGAFTFTMTAVPGTPAIQNAIPMAFFGTTLFAAPGLGVLATAIILGFGHQFGVHPRSYLLFFISRMTTSTRPARSRGMRFENGNRSSPC
jgi:hypothetical protein